MIAERIRHFFDTLFTSRLVVQLRADLDEARHERDYFKAHAARLELLLTQPRAANRDLSNLAEAPGTDRANPRPAIVGGRKTWQQLVKERRLELQRKAQEAAGKPAATPKAN